MVSREAVMAGAANYFEQEFCRKAKGVGQFSAYFMLPSIPRLVGEYMEKAERSGLMCDIFHDGMVDIDVAEARARDAMNRIGCLELMGFKMNTDDVSSLANFIRHC